MNKVVKMGLNRQIMRLEMSNSYFIEGGFF